MAILALDTAETYCSAGLLLPGGGSFVRQENIGRGHAERLMPMIEELFAEAGIGYSALGRIAVCTGPGTFTGLRIGLSVARGLALSLNIPCVGLSSLQVLAAQAPVHAGAIHAVVKGRGGQVFHQGFEGVDASGLPAPFCDAANLDDHEAHLRVEERAGYTLGSGVPLVMGRETDIGDVLDPLVLAQLATSLDPVMYPPEPFYLRAADAVKAKPVLNVADA